VERLSLMVVGWFTGTLGFLSIFRWVTVFVFAYLDLEVIKPPNRLSRAIRLGLCESLFYSGPWLVLTLIFVGYEIRRESFASPLFTGFFLGFGFLAFVVIRAFVAWRHGRAATSMPRAE